MSEGDDWRAALGHAIRQRREELDLTQEDVAERMGYSRQGPLSRWENGYVTMSLSDLWRLERALELHRGELLTRAGLV